ncbi:hypothetical protein J2X65_003451 [Ancylobacter sp. 3268]|uniref:hypothetical protein n=1 Tax=Ancylobacter sp. 3268 TaxID=2817752 RepID=UPI00285FF30B|nr:hypothetical protein [Ancylobacter sp. 3268]MDR6954083.1 hypothetical protein [Ancylobacter sp. 3268]
MPRLLATLLATLALALGAHALRAAMHGGHRATGTPFQQCMARAKKTYGPGTLPEVIRNQFTVECEATVGR